MRTLSGGENAAPTIVGERSKTLVVTLDKSIKLLKNKYLIILKCVSN